MSNPFCEDLQKHTFREACKLAAEGEEFSHLVQLLAPDRALRLRVFVQDLPESVRVNTIYGRSVSKDVPAKKKR